MTSSDIHYLELLQVGRQIQSRALSSQEVTGAMLARIGSVDPRLQSYAMLMADQAMVDARRADDEIASGKARGPLRGVPLAVKDLLWTAGVPSAHGMTIYKHHKPAEDATAVRRLRGRGAVLLGQLQQTEGVFADHHPDITPPVNPWDAAL